MASEVVEAFRNAHAEASRLQGGAVYAAQDVPGLSDADPAAPLVATLKRVLAIFAFAVSGFHNHVGTIAPETADPCFAPWAWREGDLCGPPRTFYTHALLMMSTSIEQPRVTEDYTHLFPDQPSKNLWTALSANLTAYDAVVKARNQQRARPFRAFEPLRIETAISI